MAMKTDQKYSAGLYLNLFINESFQFQLKANEFLNLDSILEGVLHGAVVAPLRAHVYALLAERFARRGDVALLTAGSQPPGAGRLLSAMGNFDTNLAANILEAHVVASFQQCSHFRRQRQRLNLQHSR